MLVADDKKMTSLAIFDFTGDAGIASTDGNKTAMLLFAKISESGKINLIERTEIDKVLREQTLSSEGKNPDHLKLGKLIGADYIVLGKIYMINNEYVFNCKLINCKTGKTNGISETFKSSSSKEESLQVFAAKASLFIISKLTE